MKGRNRKHQVKTSYRNDWKDSYIIVVATEGERTEPKYFHDLIGRVWGNSTRVKINVLPTIDGRSDPKSVFDRLTSFIQTDQGGQSDQFWMVFDKDHYQKEWLEELRTSVFSYNEANQIHIQFAISNPRFEVWLALHRRRNLSSRRVLERLERDPESMVKEIDPQYRKLFDTRYISTTSLSCARQQASSLDLNPNSTFPASPGTWVYKLCDEICKLFEE